MILEHKSPFFAYKNCTFANEKEKRNCARLCVFRDFKILDAYTIESSCYGYEAKGEEPSTYDMEPKITQFSVFNLITFGEELLQGLAKHLSVDTDLDNNIATSGFKITSDFSLGLPEQKDASKLMRSGRSFEDSKAGVDS